MREDEILRDLAALRSEAIPAEEFAAMRSAVLRQVRARRSFPWGWVAAAAAIVVCLSGALLMPRRRSAGVSVAPPAPVIAKMVEEPWHVVHVANRSLPHHRVARPRPERLPALTVKFVTDDPDVVIIWQFEKSGE